MKKCLNIYLWKIRLCLFEKIVNDTNIEKYMLNVKNLIKISDLDMLSPSHLISGSPSYILPVYDYTNVKIPPFKRWKQIQQIFQQSWKDWSRDYLQSLQVRYKWKDVQANLCVNDIVLISNETLPPAMWPLGRIIKVITGSDNLVRALAASRSIIS